MITNSSDITRIAEAIRDLRDYGMGAPATELIIRDIAPGWRLLSAASTDSEDVFLGDALHLSGGHLIPSLVLGPVEGPEGREWLIRHRDGDTIQVSGEDVYLTGEGTDLPTIETIDTEDKYAALPEGSLTASRKLAFQKIEGKWHSTVGDVLDNYMMRNIPTRLLRRGWSWED